MTGFARAEGADENHGWSWEFRSVNARNLDIRLRLPSGFDRLEAEARALVTKRFRRGNVSTTLTLKRTGPAAGFTVNREVLDQVLSLTGDLKDQFDAAPPTIDGLLGIRGVLEQVEIEPTAEQRAALEAGLIESFAAGLVSLGRVRDEEGARLGGVVDGHIDEISRLVGLAKQAAEAQPDALSARLRSRLDELLGHEPSLSEERLHQEVALLTAKADVREELDRLDSHIESARELVAADDAVGRRLDFLCQEFNREANTLCSKASEIELTRIGLDLKAAIEQLREQVQNIE